MTKTQLGKLLKATGNLYSHNLRGYLNYRQRRFNDAHRLTVLKDNDGLLYIGIRMRRPMSMFIGCRLCVVLAHGGRTRSCEYVATRDWKTLKNFWSDYIKKGVCLLDSSHSHYTHRWTYSDNERKRTCRYCGWKEKLTKTRRIVIDERWVKI